LNLFIHLIEVMTLVFNPKTFLDVDYLTLILIKMNICVSIGGLQKRLLNLELSKVTQV